jgi:hypothetical protein
MRVVVWAGAGAGACSLEHNVHRYPVRLVRNDPYFHLKSVMPILNVP